MTSRTAESPSNRPQRLVRIPTNPMASRPDPAPRASAAAVEHHAEAGPASRPIESIAVDLQGAPGWRLALIALGVALVSIVGLLVAS